MHFLPGMSPGFMLGGAAPVTSLSFVTSATSTSAGVTIPASAQVGDLLIFVDMAGDASVPTKVSPGTGWNEFIDVTAVGIEGRVVGYWKICTASDPGATVTGMGPSAGADANAVLVFRGNNRVNTVSAGTAQTEATDGNPTSKSITVAAVQTPLIVIAVFSSTGTVSPITFSPAQDGIITANAAFLIVYYKIYNSAPSNTSIDMDDEGTNNCIGGNYVSVT